MYTGKRIQEKKVDGYYFIERYNYNKPALDARPKIQVSVNYERFGLLLAYSAGIRNYVTDYYSDKEAFVNFVRAGISYRLAHLDRKH